MAVPLCPACGGRGNRPLGANPDYPQSEILRCSSCDLMWTYPVPPPEELVDDYEIKYPRRHHRALAPHYIPHKDARAAAQWTFVLQHSDLGQASDVSVLEIGCGIGSFLKAFGETSERCRLVGIEPSPLMRAHARERLPESVQLLPGLFTADRFAPASFDLVSGSHVLEHVGDPVRFLEQIRLVARPGAWLFLEVPRETEAEVTSIAAARYSGLMHLLFFERESLLATLEAAGWEPRAIAAFGPRRASFSVVPPPTRTLSRRRLAAGRLARRLHIRRPRRRRTRGTTNEVSVDAFSTSHDPDGIWLRVLARCPGT
jgi:SAM-dependent methyltransferase